MRKRGKVLVVLAVFFFALSTAHAQQTRKDIDPIALYKKGKDLFDNSFYAAAEQSFTDYLNSGDNNAGLRAEAQYYLAISAMELYQDNAEALLNQFTRDYPVNPKARLANYYLGKFEWRNKNFAKAITTFEKVDPADLSDREVNEYNWMIGYAYFQKKEFAKAKPYLAKVKDLPGENKAIASYYYGNIEYQQGNYKEALLEFEKIKNEKKFKTVIPVYITQIYLLQGKYDKVISVGEEALKDKTTEKNDEIKLYVAEAYFLQKDYAKATEYYKSYTGTLGEHHMYQYGYCLLKQEQYADAIAVMNGLTVNEDSLGQDISYNLGNAYIHTNEKEKARTAYQFASGLSFIPIIKEVSLLNYAKLSFELGFPKEAIEGFKQFIKDYPSAKHTEEANEYLAQVLLHADNLKEALDIIENIPRRSTKLNEAYQRILYSYGLSLFNNHKYEEALENFGKSLKYPIDEKIKALAYFWAGESHYKISENDKNNTDEQIDKALANYKLFLGVGASEETPYIGFAYYNLGYCYFKKEQYVDSRTYFGKYMATESKRVPRVVDAILRKADCNFALKHYPDAMSGYEDVIESHAPETDYALYQKGLIQGLQGHDEDKISTMRLISKTSPYADDAQYAVAETYKINGNHEQAIKEYRSLNYNFPKNPYFVKAMFNIGQEYINQNQDGKGISVFKTIVSQYPNNPEAQQSLKRIQNSYIERGLSDSLEELTHNFPGIKNSEQDSLYYATAFSNIKNDDCPAAVKAFKKYATKYPNGVFSVDAHYYTADCEMSNGSKAAAIEDYNYVIAKSPNPYMEKSLKNCAGLYYDDKNYVIALQRYKQLEEIAADKQNVLLSLNGQLRSSYNLAQYEPSIETGNKILNLAYADDKSKIEAQFYMAKSELELNHLDQALAGFEVVAKNDKSDMGAEALYQTAYIHFAQDKNKDAQTIIYNLSHSDFSDFWKAKGFILLSDILVKTGDDFQAKSTLQSIIKNYDGADLVKIAEQKLQEIKDREAKAKPADDKPGPAKDKKEKEETPNE